MNVTPSLPLSEATVEVDGLPIYCRTGGSGPPLLWLHGIPVSGKTIEPFADSFGAHHMLIAPDLPGHGRSGRPRDAFSFQDTARTMFGLLDRLGHDRVCCIGQSGGATLLLQMALLQPERIESMVVVSGAHRIVQSHRDYLRHVTWEALASAEQARYLSHHPGGMAQIAWLVGVVHGLADNYGDCEASPERLATIQARTLLVWGDRDEAYPVELALEMYRAIPDCALWVIPGAGHGAVWESADAIEPFPVVVHAFLEETPEG